jgi:hypothetical protein
MVRYSRQSIASGASFLSLPLLLYRLPTL